MYMKFKSITMLALSFLVFLFFTIPLNAKAAETYGTILSWDGQIDGSFYTNTLEMQFRYTDYSTGDNTATLYYSGQSNGLITINNLKPGYTYNGTLYKSFRAYTAGNPSSALRNSKIDILSQMSGSIDGVYLDFRIIGRDGTVPETTYIIAINIQNYVATSSTLRIPVINTADYNYSNLYSESEPRPQVDVYTEVLEDWAGDLVEYSDYRDVPSYDGYMAHGLFSVNEELNNGFTLLWETLVNQFSNLTTNISGQFTLLKNDITSHFSALTSNLSAWYNGIKSHLSNWENNLNTNLGGWFSSIRMLMSQNHEAAIENDNANHEAAIENDNAIHDETVNGYENDSFINKNDELNEVVDSVGEMETFVLESGYVGIGNFIESAQDSAPVSYLGSSLLFVVTWFNNFWNMGGLFTNVLSYSLILFVMFFIFRIRSK